LTKVLLLGQEEEGLIYLAEALGSPKFVCSHKCLSEAADDLALVVADLVVVDAPLVNADVLAACRKMRNLLAIPLVLCSMSNSESDIVASFDAGVDDYLILPMRPAEISARIMALVRRSARRDAPGADSGVVLAGDLEIDIANGRVVHQGTAIALSPTEFRLLAALVRGNGRAVSHTALLAAVWGPEYVDSRNYLRLYIAYLRTKLEHDPSEPRLIVNEWGIGYRFNIDAVP
jgi:two-component system KDP operon response regulator KdpE